MENKKESKTYAVIGILTFVFIMSLFILLGQKARAQEVGSGIPKLHGLTGSSPAALSANSACKNLAVYSAFGNPEIFPAMPVPPMPEYQPTTVSGRTATPVCAPWRST